MMLLAMAAALSLQLETGVVKMSGAPDDFWVERALPHSTEFNTVAFGASLRYDVGNVQLSAGWRNLGNQHQWTDIISDADYFKCRGKPSTCPKTIETWNMTGSEQQTFAELGYAFHLGGWKLVPSAGLAITRIASHVNLFWKDGKYIETGPAAFQRLGKPFFGITLQKGDFGVGVYQLNTEPNRGDNNWKSPIQGSSAIYVRVTYGVKL